jgi:dihydrofolate synthase/folylpolyglutamate synthase
MSARPVSKTPAKSASAPAKAAPAPPSLQAPADDARVAASGDSAQTLADVTLAPAAGTSAPASGSSAPASPIAQALAPAVAPAHGPGAPASASGSGPAGAAPAASAPPVPLACFADLAAHLDARGLFHMDFGLGRMRAALAALGLAERTGRPAAAPGAGAGPRPAAVQVVGTNGKGSVSLMLAGIMRAHGLRAGLYSSPHFVDVRERVLVDGRKLDQAAWTELGNAVLATSGGPELTYFECVTAIAALGFVRAGCDAAVLEAGLGGAHDATTALDADLTVFTALGLDHMAVLGPTLEDIARDKAGAMRPGVPAVSGPQPPEALAVLRARAREIGAPFMTVDEVPGLPAAAPAPAMAGEHQRENAALALAAWTVLARSRGWASDPAACARAVGAARLPGRLQRVPGGPGRAELWLDGAHNVPALERLARAVGRAVPRPGAVIFACMADKDLARMAPLVAGLTDGPLWLPALPGVSRALAPGACAAALGPRAVPLPGLEQALELADGLGGRAGAPGPVLVCGSLYLLGAFFALRPEALGSPGPDLPLPRPRTPGA